MVDLVGIKGMAVLECKAIGDLGGIMVDMKDIGDLGDIMDPIMGITDTMGRIMDGLDIATPR